MGLYVAAIPHTVKNHFHTSGSEEYAIVGGIGEFFFGSVTKAHDGTYHVSARFQRSVQVKTGDSFIVPEKCAHQLVNRGGSDLIILFRCPASHLSKTEDWTPVTDFITE